MRHACSWIGSVLLFAGLLLMVWFRAEAAVPLTQGLVTETSSAQFVREIIPSSAIANVGLSSPSIFRIDHPDGSSTFALSGSNEIRFHHTTFGSLGSHAVPDQFLGFGLELSATGRPDMVFRYLWGPQGSASSYDVLTFTVVNNDSWVGAVRPPVGLGDPFGFSISLMCQSNPCSARVSPYFAVTPVPEPSKSVLLAIGFLAVVLGVRRKAKQVRRRTYFVP